MRYIDRDGDTWETTADDRLKCTARSSSDPFGYIGTVMDRDDCETQHGPLRLVDDTPAFLGMARTIRAELATVLQEMADEAYSAYRWRDGVDADICYRVHELFEAKSKALRAEVGE